MKFYLSAVFLLVLSFFRTQEIQDKDAFKKCRKEFNKKICISDQDKDAILFYLDRCPDDAGLSEHSGCPLPDIDKDGVCDKDDLCPDIAGPTENSGCPWFDYDGDGILDKDDACPDVFGYASDNPSSNGCMKQDCKKAYEEGQIRLKRFKEESLMADYSKLREKVVNDINLKLLNHKDVVIFTKYEFLTCGTTSKNYNYDCPSYYNYQIPVFSTEDFWNEEVILQLYDRLPKNIIFATKREGEGAGVEYEKKSILNKINKKIKINKYTDEEDAVLYPKYKESTVKINQYSSLSIEISQNDFENKITVQTGYSTFPYGNTAVYKTMYQYINGEWKNIELKKEN